MHAAQAVAPGFDAADYFGYPRRQYHRLREMEAFLRRVVEPDLEQSGLGLRLRYLSGGMSPTARLVGGRVLPERAGYYLGYRMTEALVAERGLAEAVRAPAQEFQAAEDVARGIQTARRTASTRSSATSPRRSSQTPDPGPPRYPPPRRARRARSSLPGRGARRAPRRPRRGDARSAPASALARPGQRGAVPRPGERRLQVGQRRSARRRPAPPPPGAARPALRRSPPTRRALARRRGRRDPPWCAPRASARSRAMRRLVRARLAGPPRRRAAPDRPTAR